jgi:trk system potassium uptake protein TrkH
MPIQVTGAISKYPARASVAGFLGLIAVGTACLALPVCRKPDAAPLRLIDALFTATSASCVTGLSVRSTGNDFSSLGQLAILAMIQIGGIGIMTITTLVTFQIGRRGGLRDRAVIAETLGARAHTDLRSVLRRVVLVAGAFEAAGFVVLFAYNLFDLAPGPAAWHALFHSISAFCNAGFGLADDSLCAYRGSPIVNLTICALIIAGGIGFPVMLDLQRSWRGSWRQMWHHLHLHSKVMLIGTVALLLSGTILFAVLEWDGVLEPLPLGEKLQVAFFQSVTCRTAGFNTVPIGALTNATLFIMILLMLIGAGPCSTAGGFKVSTLSALVMRAWSAFRGSEATNAFRRTVPEAVFVRANATAMLFLVVAASGLTVLLAVEQSYAGSSDTRGMYLEAAFEVASALGTVGLSTGLTANLTDAGKVVIMLLMFMGRLGPISVFAALSWEGPEQHLTYPYEEPLVG